MNVKLTLAVAAAALAAAPVALAQSSGTGGYSNDASRSGYERGSPSGLPTTSPQVRSLPGEEPNPWEEPGTPSSRSQSAPSWGGATSGSTMGSSVGPSGSTGGAAGTMMDHRGTTGGSTMSGDRQVLMNVQPDTQGRTGRGQNRTELMQTSLLNYFSAAGFTAVRDFRKQGQNYVAEAQDPNGRWTTVELDPRSGTITALR